MASFFASLALLALTWGCAPPNTPYRYTGLAPAPRPIAWDGRAAKAGTLRVEGTMSESTVIPNPAPVLHDTALFVPEWTAEGSAVIAVSDEVELGLRAQYAAYEWAKASAVGTMPLPSKPSTWGVGPELRMAFPFDDEKRFVLGLAANVMRHDVPYAEWTLTGRGSPTGAAACTPSYSCMEQIDGSAYQLHDERSETHLTYTLGVYPSFAIGDRGEFGHAFALIAATNGFKNDGFTDTPTNGSTVQVTGPLWIVGAGYGLSLDAIRFSGVVYKPLTDEQSPIDYGLSFQISLGVNLELWSSSRRAAEGEARED